MKQNLYVLFIMVLCCLCLAQTSRPADGWEPSKLNQPRQQYPRVNSEGCARFRIVAPQAQSVAVNLGSTGLTMGEDGVWTGTMPRHWMRAALSPRICSTFVP